MLSVIFKAYAIDVHIVTIDECKFVAKIDNTVDTTTFDTILGI